MERSENQVTRNLTTSEEKTYDLGQKDKAFARVQNSKNETSQATRNRLAVIGRRVKEKFGVAGTTTKRRIAAARNRTTIKAKECRATVERQTQAHPIKSVAYTFAAGAVVGLLLSRTRR